MSKRTLEALRQVEDLADRADPDHPGPAIDDLARAIVDLARVCRYLDEGIDDLAEQVAELVEEDGGAEDGREEDE